MDERKTPREQSHRGPKASESSRPCHYFLQTGRCRFGDYCKFAHPDPTEQRQSQASTFGHHRQSHPSHDKLREWKRLLNHASPNRGNVRTRLGHTIVNQFFERGLELMDGEMGDSQEAVRLLGGEAGLNFVRAMADQNVMDATCDTAKVNLWETQVSPFFRLITHPRLLESNVLEQEVSGIYSFLVGINASRVNQLFAYVIDVVEALPSVGSTLSPVMTVLELSLSVLSKAVNCSTTILLNEEFHCIADRFADLVNGWDQAEDDFSRLQAVKYLDYLQRRLSIGKNIDVFKPAQTAPPKREEFVLRRDLPGRLSADGPRHDNDHADIALIQIMPTYQEIKASRSEYLPSTDSSTWHVPGICGRLDREFRLLREDTIGQLRDAIHDILGPVRDQSKNSARTSAYEDAEITDVAIDRHNGLELEVQCRQPYMTFNLSEQERRTWWDQSKRLQVGALVCVLDITGTIQFFTVAESTLRTEKDDKANKRKADGEELEPTGNEPRTLSFSRDFLYVRLHLVDKSEAELDRTLRWCKGIGPSPIRRLVEFPGVLLASFKHTLEALQKLSQNPDLPFSDLIAPEMRTSRTGPCVVSPPLFARAPGFQYDLDCLVQTGENGFSASLDRMPSADEISAKTPLDLTQSQALLNTLSREFSLIQGPPGTGKSFTGEKIIQVLLANSNKAKLGPIICVCYTNHALDQLLEHLLDLGVDGVIRMGARSKSERLQQLNLQLIAEKMEMTKAEKQDNWRQRKTMRELQQKIQHLLRRLASCDTPALIREYLGSTNRFHHDELFHESKLDDEGWEIIEKSINNPVRQWLREAVVPAFHTPSNIRDLAVLQTISLGGMTGPEREVIYCHWLENIRDPIIHELIDLHQDHETAKLQRDRIRQEIRHRCLQQARIIGVTTTGLARELSLLRKLRSKVVVCEEAGEVLEAHLLTTLLPSVEQAILIGDHLQLRPQIQNYDLQSTNPRGAQFSLDTSLFERLVQPPHSTDLKLPFSTLETQRRMHPSIAEMVRSTLYSGLTDGAAVKDYPEVVGMGRRLFWLDHNQLEKGAIDADPSNTSHSNLFEVEMGAALVSHLIKQGHYNPEDIAILTPYLGQLLRLRQRMAAEQTFAVSIDDRDMEELQTLDEQASKEPFHLRKENVTKTTLLRSVRLATVDNFQGEEAKVIIISLVRSNPQNKCGFLSTSNRINVLLSRAKHGCYLIGNSVTYSNVPMWNQVLQLLKAGGNFGTSLELKCPRHPETPIFASHLDHFSTFSPDGGCILACDRRLNCGHACHGRCHSELLHKAVKCHEKCPRPKSGCDHACPRECGDACEDRCNIVLRNLNLQLPCGHTVHSAKCWEAQDPAAIRCQELVDRKIPDCDHTLKLACYIDVSHSTFRCTAECRENLPCGHDCRSKCHHCRPRMDGNMTVTNHGICKQQCGRRYTACPHNCQSVCHGEMKCVPCPQPCDVRCSHSRCSKPCHEPCAPCAEEFCASNCPHTSCSMPCAAPCDWVPCWRRCDSILTCGHRCPSLCGETCPDARYCQKCGSEAILSTIVDYLLMGEYRDVDLDEDPCIFPDCGHFLTKSSMDGQMSMSDHYELSDDGSPIAIKAPLAPFSMDGSTVKSCPQCRGSLRSIPRYGRIVRRAMLDEATKKFISWSGNRHLELAERFLQEEQRLEHDQEDVSDDTGKIAKLDLTGHVSGQLLQLQTWAGKGRYRQSIRVYLDIVRYRDQVKAEEQPFQKVANFVKYANRNRTTSNFAFEESVIQLRGYLLATELLIKCNLAILSDSLKLWARSDPSDKEIKVDFSANFEQCKELIELAAGTSRPQLEAAGHVYYAHFCGLTLTLGDFPLPSPQLTDGFQCALQRTRETPAVPEPREALKSQGQHHINKARALMAAHNWPSKQILETEIEAVERLIQEGVFYKPVTTEELRAVYTAMAAEFAGTGHWYTCVEGHPFTVGECGLPMQEARCPECGAPVGGQSHVPAEGVTRAREIEDLAGDVENIRI